MSKCKIIVNGQEHNMLSNVYDHIDNTDPGKRSAAKVIDVLKDNRLITEMPDSDELYASQEQLKELKLINQLTPNLISAEYVDIPFTSNNQSTNLYKVSINETALQQADRKEGQDSSLDYTSEYELDKFKRLQAKKKASPETKQESEEKATPDTRKVYTDPTRSYEKMMNLALDAKIIIESELREINKLPEDQREAKEKRLRRLKAAVSDIKRIENFRAFVVASKDNVDNAILEFEALMALPIKERATPANMTRMYEIKQAIDSVDTIRQLEQIAKEQSALGKVNTVAQRDFGLMMTDIQDTIENVKMLDYQFGEEVIPVMAEVLQGYHNVAIDPKIQAIIDNIEANQNPKTWRRFRSEVQASTEFKKLKEDLANKAITEQAFDAAAKKMVVNTLKNRKIEGRDKLINDLRSAHKDKSGFSYLFDPLMYSSDVTVQLFAKMVKEATFKKNDMTLALKPELRTEYELFAEGQNETDIEGLNGDLQEETTVVEYDEYNNKTEKKVLGLVQPLLVDKYQEDLDAFEATINSKYSKPLRDKYKTADAYRAAVKTWRKSNSGKKHAGEVIKWTRENTEPIADWKKEVKKLNAKKTSLQKDRKAAEKKGRTGAVDNIDQQLGLINAELRNNLVQGIPTGKFVKPKASVYANPKYAAVQADPRKKRYYDYVLKTLNDRHRMVGMNRVRKNAWEDVSYMMPSLRKEDYDRMKEQGGVSAVKDILAESFTIQDTDIVNGNYNKATGELNKNVPVFYVNNIDAKDVSRDIASSLYAYADMAHNYKAKSEIVGQVMTFRNIMKDRDTMKVNAAGMEILDRSAKKLGVKLPMLKEGESYTFQHVDAFIDMVMFGQKELKQNITLAGKEFSATKIVNAFNSFTAFNALSFNFLQGANQSIIDNMGIFSEAVAGEFFTTKDLSWAKSSYWGQSAAIGDTGKFMPDTKLGKALEYFDALTEFTDQEGNRLVGSKLRKALQAGNLLVLQQAAEHEVASTRMLALMKNLEGKLKDKDGKVLLNEDGKPANLYDMLVVKPDGSMEVDSRVANFNRYDFINLTQGLARRTNQTKGGFDKATASRTAQGKAVLLFRSWVMPGLRRRYGHGGFTGPTLHADEELGSVTQGMYVSFWNMLQSSVEQRVMPHTVFQDLTDMEKANVKRTLTELGSLAAASVLIMGLTSLDDDEENYATNFLLYQALRYQAEIKQWTPVYGSREALRIIKSPAATVRQVESTLNLFDQVYKEGLYAFGYPLEDKDIYYQRKTGRYNKGDRKIRKQVEDLMPGLRGFTKSGNPEDAAQYFLGGTYK